MNQNLPATSIQLLQTAERLFAREGIDAVSTRRIAQEANQRNVSALQYHFGSRDNLIDALLMMRLETINARRQTLFDALGETADFHSLLMALVLPLVEQLGEPDSHFVGCLYQLYLRARGDQVYSNLPAEYTAALTAVTAAIERRMNDLPLAVRIGRLRLIGPQLIHSVGDWYYQRERGEALAPVAELAGMLVDFLAGGLLAPVTPLPAEPPARKKR
jgi:AcrR family transcriptional regulator